MRYEHRFRVEAPQEAVADFHRSARSLKAITPPPIILQVHEAPDPLNDGDHVIFTMWMGPLPIRWDSQIENISEKGFTDTQVRGPYASWEHHHHFIRIDDDLTEVYDVVNVSLRYHLLWYPVQVLMWLGLPLLFAYRGWRTRRLLEKPAAA